VGNLPPLQPDESDLPFPDGDLPEGDLPDDDPDVVAGMARRFELKSGEADVSEVHT